MTKEQFETTKIENLQVSQRCYNALYRRGYRVIGDLVGKTPEQLQNIRNIGGKTFAELNEKLISIGFMLNEEGAYVIDTNKLIQDNIRVLEDASIKDLVESIDDLTKLIEHKQKELNNLVHLLKSTETELKTRINQQQEETTNADTLLRNSKKYVIR